VNAPINPSPGSSQRTSTTRRPRSAGNSAVQSGRPSELRCPAAGQPSIAVAEAEQILDDELRRCEATIRARATAPSLAGLHRLGLKLAHEEADHALARLDYLSDVQRQVVREMAERLVRRLLYSMIRSLRAGVPDGGEAAKRTALSLTQRERQYLAATVQLYQALSGGWTS
jgi:hypothetical protein